MNNLTNSARIATPVRQENEHPDYRISEAFKSAHGSRFRYDVSSGRWLEFDGNILRTTRPGRVRFLAKGLAVKLGFGQQSHLLGAERMLQDDEELVVSAEKLDSDPMLLGTPSGPVDLATGKSVPARIDQLLTQSTSLPPASGEPVAWLNFLEQATGGDAEVLAYLKRLLGYCLTGSTREQMFVFIHGPGGTGKSVFINTVTKILGDYAAWATPDLLARKSRTGASEDLARLVGRRLVAGSETAEGMSWDEQRLKSLTGGDVIAVRHLYKSTFEYQPRFKLVVVGNHAPNFSTLDDAIRRRVQVVPFTRRPESADLDLEAKLLEEGGQILQWAIAGAVEWNRDGLNPPDAVAKASAAYFAREDSVGRWLEDCCEMEPGAWGRRADLLKSWNEWADSNSESTKSSKWLYDQLRGRGLAELKKNGILGFSGVKI